MNNGHDDLEKRISRFKPVKMPVALKADILSQVDSLEAKTGTSRNKVISFPAWFVRRISIAAALLVLFGGSVMLVRTGMGINDARSIFGSDSTGNVIQVHQPGSNMEHFIYQSMGSALDFNDVSRVCLAMLTTNNSSL